MEEVSFQAGIYQHFRGNRYRAHGVARHSETLEWMVIYEPLYQSDLAKMWVRPLAMFNQQVEHNGKTVPRFSLVSAQST